MSLDSKLKIDRLFMKQALKLASKGRFTTFPNPAVGCVIVRDGRIIGRGYHHKAGQPHAEVMALKNANFDVKGATAYVTLEPCSHYGRTPPCAKTLSEAGISRCVIACTDPNPKVSGRGIKILRDAGVEVSEHVLENQALFLNRAFMKSVIGPYPYVSVKVAMSTDAKSALSDGQSKWITSEKSRSHVQKLRAQSDVIITGSDTIIADNPRLNVRFNELPKKVLKAIGDTPFKQPLKVVLDSRRRLSPDAFPIFKEGNTLLVHASGNGNCDYTEQKYSECLTILYLPKDGEHIDLKALLKYLGERSYRHCFIEAGATLSSAFIEQNLVDELYVFIAPKLLGYQGRQAFKINSPKLLSDALKFKLHKLKKCGDDVLLHLLKEE